MRNPDTDKTNVGAPSGATVLDIGPAILPDTVSIKREDARWLLARNLTYALIGIIGFVLVTIAIIPDRTAAFRDILPVILAGLFGIYGTVIGFYFGEKR